MAYIIEKQYRYITETQKVFDHCVTYITACTVP